MGYIVWCYGDEQEEEIKSLEGVAFSIEDLEVKKMTGGMRDEWFVRAKPSIILQDKEGHSIYEVKGIWTDKDKLITIIKNHQKGKKGMEMLWR